MNFIELFLIAIGLSMDAFAISVCAGLTIKKVTAKKLWTIGLYFGVSQALMPLIGYLVATRFAEKIVALDHWVAFALLSFLGLKMIRQSFKQTGCPDRKCSDETCHDRVCPKTDCHEMSLKPSHMLPLALATSMDALAVGISFAFLKVRIVSAVLFIGITTLVLSMLGVGIGRIFGAKCKSKAELAGGIILVLMGVNILLGHLLS